MPVADECGNCGYPLQADWSSCPECGGDREQSAALSAARRRRRQIARLSCAIAAAASPAFAPIVVPSMPVIVWSQMLQLLATPVSVLLWARLHAVMDPDAPWFANLFVGLVFGVFVQFSAMGLGAAIAGL